MRYFSIRKELKGGKYTRVKQQTRIGEFVAWERMGLLNRSGIRGSSLRKLNQYFRITDIVTDLAQLRKIGIVPRPVSGAPGMASVNIGSCRVIQVIIDCRISHGQDTVSG